MYCKNNNTLKLYIVYKKIVNVKIHNCYEHVNWYRCYSQMGPTARSCLIQYKGLRVHSGRISGLAARRLTPVLAKLHSTCAVITNRDPDHVWRDAKRSRTLIYKRTPFAWNVIKRQLTLSLEIVTLVSRVKYLQKKNQVCFLSFMISNLCNMRQIARKFRISHFIFFKQLHRLYYMRVHSFN